MPSIQRRSAAGFCAVAIATLLLVNGTASPAQAQDADFKCRQAIDKEYAKYVATVVKILQKCNDVAVRTGSGDAAPGGDVVGCDPNGKIAAARAKMTDKIVGKCDDDGITPADVGWPATCPNFESGTCTNAIASGTDVATCLDCIGRAAVTQAIDRYYLDLSEANGDRDLIKCQRAVGKEAAKFLTAKQKALEKCRKQIDKGHGSLPCPAPGDGKAGAAIAKAESKKVAKICRACGTRSLDGVTCPAPAFTAEEVGFAAHCPAVTVPFGGPACGASVASLNDLVACVDCITEFKVDCMDALARPDQVGYPPECDAAVPTPTPTITPTPTVTATVTPACGNGVLDGAEECDDGGTADGDGCSSTCQLESANPAVCAGVPSVSGTSLDAVRIASGYEAPVHLSAPRLDPSRLFVVEQPGRIQVIKNGIQLGTPFLDITSLVTYSGGEQGLLSVAFDPDYENNRRFFVYYNNNDGDVVIARYLATLGDPDTADVSTAHIVITIPHPSQTNHNGGNLNFSPVDGFLYAGTGDGGGGGDPFENAQNDASHLGKLLRIDPDTDAVTNWAKGLRNPFHWSFDRANGDIYIGDVGQGRWEEIDYVPGNPSGTNYGWDDMEGRHCFEPTSGCLTAGRTLPVLEYCNSAFSNAACSTFQSEKGQAVIGGFVYRGCAMPDLRGRYFYADFYTAFIRSFMGVSGGDAQSRMSHTADLDPPGPLAIDNVSGFGEDTRGELYIVDYDGDIFEIVPGS